MTEPSILNPTGYQPEKTVAYKTYLKTALVKAIRLVFDEHPDPRIRTEYGPEDEVVSGTQVGIEYPTDERAYPTVMIRYVERIVENTGVGHKEFIENPETKGIDAYKHSYYRGAAEFVIFALTSVDRDLISDALTQILRMPEMEEYTNHFFNQIFNIELATPNLNYVNINTDSILGLGETVSPQPWLSENQLVYQSGYRTDIFGEFYSLPQNKAPQQYIEDVAVYPYIASIGETVPSGYIANGEYPFPEE